MPIFMTMDHASMEAPWSRAEGASVCADNLPLSSPAKPLAQEEASDSASTCATDLLLVLPFPEQELVVANTFITLPAEREGAARRESSCPPSIHTPTTVMLRNLPNRAKPGKVEEHVRALGFHEFQTHVPIDARTGVNKGYAFVRFLDEAEALEFCACVQGTRLPSTHASTKRLVAVKAANQSGPLKPRAIHHATHRGRA